MKVIQILPELNTGGVERGTLEIAEYLINQGHQSIVISNGGRLVPSLISNGSTHLELAVHKKSILSLLQISKLLRIFLLEKPDIIHVRSRVPAWLAWLAWRSLPKYNRPKFITTVHGFYSVNKYSEIMTRGQRVIAVSESVRSYILENYQKTDPSLIRVIHRGVDLETYTPEFIPNADWLQKWRAELPQLANRIILLLPGRLTRWKGQEDFIRVVANLKKNNLPIHALIVGEAHVKKQSYQQELNNLVTSLNLSDTISFLGHRSDLREIMSQSNIIYSLSHQPEAFGRVSLEAMALGKPVIAYNHGGVAEQLNIAFPQGLVPVGSVQDVEESTYNLVESPAKPMSVEAFSLARMRQSTLAVYLESIQNVEK